RELRRAGAGAARGARRRPADRRPLGAAKSARRSAIEPAGPATRPEVLLLGDEGGGRLLERACRLRPGEEVDVDPAHATRSELDVARTAPVVRRRLLPSL